MNLNSILLTNSGVNQFTGGGIVSFNLLKAMQEVSSVKLILSNQHFKDGKYFAPEEIQTYCIEPGQYGYYDPFFMDYMASSLIPDIPIELVQTYACPFGNTIEKLKTKYLAKVVADIAPHNIETSMQEHIKWQGSYPYPHLTNKFLWKLYSRHLCLADKVVVHSHSSAKYLEKAAGLKRTPAVIPHGCYLPSQQPISVSSYSLLDYTSYPSEVTPGYFGALGADKGIVYMVTAWRNCNQPNKLIIGGRDAKGFKLETDMDKFNVLGVVDNIADFYLNISFYIQPSVVEGFGITPLEAMAFGRPVIVAEGAGMCELVTDGKDGFVVPIRDVKAIKDKIDYFFDNPDEIQKMGKEARKTAEKYTWDKIRKQYVDIYKELLG